MLLPPGTAMHCRFAAAGVVLISLLLLAAKSRMLFGKHSLCGSSQSVCGFFSACGQQRNVAE